jgi:peroxiredoxin
MVGINMNRRRTAPSARSRADELVKVGDLAPEFELVDHEGTKRKLSSFRGKRVLLSFYRFAA